MAQSGVRALGWAGWAVHGAGRGNALAGRGAGRIGPGEVSRPGKGSFRWVLGWQAALTGRGGLRVWAGGKVRWVWVG